ncbi:MAG: nuclear transport factor 2 family protein [Actinomycetota bacterium]|nr:nuclear transport factor 2 family protein [Actinomycetota bacterium]
MSRENVEIVRAWAQAFNRRDIDSLADLCSPSFEFVPYLASLIERTTYRGHDGLRKYFEDADAAWEVVQVRLNQLREVGEHFLVTGELHGKGRASGLDVVVPLAWTGAIMGGQIAWVHTHETEAAALEAVGLRE